MGVHVDAVHPHRRFICVYYEDVCVCVCVNVCVCVCVCVRAVCVSVSQDDLWLVFTMPYFGAGPLLPVHT